MNNQEIQQKLTDYHPLLHKLSIYPLKVFTGASATYLYLTQDEQEELYYELQCKFIELCHQFEGGRGVPFAGYIKSKLGWFAHHQAEKLFEEKKYRQQVEDMDRLLVEVEIDDPSSEEEHEVLSDQYVEMIEGLPNRQRQVIRMHYIENKSMKEIARTLSLHVDECYRHRKLGLNNLRKKIEKGY